jgi:hypothetical protein
MMADAFWGGISRKPTSASAQGKVALAKVRRMRKAGKSVAEILAWARAA